MGPASRGLSVGGGAAGRRERREETPQEEAEAGDRQRGFARAERSFSCRAVSQRRGFVGCARLRRCPREGGRSRARTLG